MVKEVVTKTLDENPERTHEAIVLHIKRHGEMTVAELCDVLKITSMAVRRHLIGLQNEGLVDCRIVKQTRGRPTYRYKLTEKASKLFPSGVEALASDILEVVADLHGPEAVIDLLKARNDKLQKRLIEETSGLSLEEKVKAVADFFSTNGYMSEWQRLPDGNFILYQRHCAVHNLASQYRQLCGLEPKLIENVLGVKVSRQQYLLNNDPVCSYLVHAD